MIDKTKADAAAAVADIGNGATVLIGGFGTAGSPDPLIEALIAQGAGDLTIISNNAGNGENGIAALIKAGRVRKMVCSFPRQSDSHHFDAAYRAGSLELELVPQGNLAARIQAAGAGLGAIFTPTGYGTALAEGGAFFSEATADAPHSHDADAARADAARDGEASLQPGTASGKAVGLHDLASAGENQAQSKVGDVLGKLIRCVGQVDVPRRELRGVDAIEPGTEREDEAEIRQAIKQFLRDAHERAGRDGDMAW